MNTRKEERRFWGQASFSFQSLKKNVLFRCLASKSFLSTTALGFFPLLSLLACTQQEFSYTNQQQVAESFESLAKEQVKLDTLAQLKSKSLEEQRQNIDLTRLHLEKELEQASNKLKGVQEKFSQLKPALPKLDERDEGETPPKTLTEYLRLKAEINKLEGQLAVATVLEKNEEEFDFEVLELRSLLSQVRNFWSQLLALDLKTETLQNSLLLAQEAYELALANNWRWAKELPLYFLGFKWLWGAFTGYSPSSDTYQVSLQLAEAKQALWQFQLSANKKRSLLELSYQKALKDFELKAKNTLGKTLSLAKRRNIELLTVLLPQFFEEARELILRDVLVSRKAHERGSIVAKIHKSRIAREEWELEGFTISPKFLLQFLVTLASKTVDTKTVYDELQARVSTAVSAQGVGTTNNSEEPLKEIGFKPTDTALILDLITYLALENVAFYRFLDLDSCESLLSWMDYEYLNEKGSHQAKYRTQVESQCSTLNTALKTFASGLEQVLELHPALRWQAEGSFSAGVSWRRRRLETPLYSAQQNPFYVSSQGRSTTLEQRLKDIFESFKEESSKLSSSEGARTVEPVAKSGVLFSTGERSEPGLASSFFFKKWNRAVKVKT